MPSRAASSAAFLFAFALCITAPTLAGAESYEAPPVPAEVAGGVTNVPVDGGFASDDATSLDQLELAPDVPALIVDAATRYGLDSDRMLRVAWCESRWNPTARGAGGASGVFQFIPSTWAWASAGAGQQGASVFDAVANVESAAWLMATSGPRQWGCR